MIIFRTRLFRSVLSLCSVAVITACGSGGAQESPPFGNASGAPVVTLGANPGSVASGATSLLTWSSTDATSCTASGGWSGTKPTSGSESTAALTQTTSFTLTCTGAGGSASQTAQVTVTSAPGPTVSISASPSTITAGQSSTLTWSSTNATSCTASGGWSGGRNTSGTQSVSPTSTTTYTLVCNGGGGSAQQSTQITVNPATTPAPTVTLTATPPSIVVNGTTTLTWSATNATACTASGGWSGSKGVTGNEVVGPLAASTDFTLTCTGAGGSGSTTTNVAVTGGSGGSSIVGAVDSVHIDLNGANRVYVFAGAGATPRDYRGTASDPIASIAVNQDENACTFSYASGSIAPGTYTVAFTSQAQNDNPTTQETLSFIGAANVTVGATPATQNFPATTVRRVGPGRTYATVAAAASGIAAGTVVEIDAGTYTDDFVTWSANNIVVRGVGGVAHMRGTSQIGNGKGIFVTRGSRMRIENMEFSGATVADQNGAGIRGEGSNLTVCRSSFHDNENGILADDAGTLTIEYSTFASNGLGDGYTHNLYIGVAERLVFRHNYSHHAKIGHNLKSRARENFILYNRIMDEATGTSSYIVDVPNGGLTYLIGNLLQQGPDADNSIIVAYGQEGLSSGRTHNFYMINNTVVNDRSSGTFVGSNGGTAVFQSSNNFFVGNGTLYSGKQPTTAANNISSNSPGLVDRAGYDYRLTSGSPARDAGASVGTGDGYALTPVYEYVHPAGRQLRKTNAPPIDVGAYEY